MSSPLLGQSLWLVLLDTDAWHIFGIGVGQGEIIGGGLVVGSTVVVGYRFMTRKKRYGRE